MSFLINNAWAGMDSIHPMGSGDGSFSMIMLLAIFILFYFMMIRPQNKRAKDHQDLIGKLKKGDEVVLSSGIIGKVEDLLNQVYVKVKLGTGVEIIVQRDAIASLLPKGTLESL